MKIAVLGPGGFVGSAVVAAAEARGMVIHRLAGIRVCGRMRDSVLASADRWSAENKRQFDQLVTSLAGAQAVVNAAGLAEPDCSDVERLNGANAVMPAVLARATATAGVPRMVHISSAAVQGSRRVLDESFEHEPFSPYSRSKALGENVLLSWHLPTPHIVVYRPTSVQGRGRHITEQLVRLSMRRFVPVCNGGTNPLPLALVDNVGAAAVHLATTAEPPRIALHPWEGVTVGSMYELFGGRPRLLPIPVVAAKAGIRLLYPVGRAVPRITGITRRAELLLLGQRIEARALPTSGFKLPVGLEGYSEVAAAIATFTDAKP